MADVGPGTGRASISAAHAGRRCFIPCGWTTSNVRGRTRRPRRTASTSTRRRAGRLVGRARAAAALTTPRRRMSGCAAASSRMSFSTPPAPGMNIRNSTPCSAAATISSSAVQVGLLVARGEVHGRGRRPRSASRRGRAARPGACSRRRAAPPTGPCRRRRRAASSISSAVVELRAEAGRRPVRAARPHLRAPAATRGTCCGRARRGRRSGRCTSTPAASSRARAAAFSSPVRAWASVTPLPDCDRAVGEHDVRARAERLQPAQQLLVGELEERRVDARRALSSSSSMRVRSPAGEERADACRRAACRCRP